MAQLVVRNIEEALKERLRRRAKRHGRSMEEEARDILRQAVAVEGPRGGLGSEIAARFAKLGLDRDIAELRNYELEPPSFDS
jgi:plasmid stability protein